ncbi:MAG: SDR family NAD(P)-dependent oxidoreductase [Sphingobacteriales bacterium]|jgi:3-hydroxy acid dehydrogenase/malonic semialdehyde reductase|nr:SDR family NAD(P)-dependent oxidoreductase [Sphingobacteriales bacterium]
MVALITGATSGFGKAIAELFASKQWNLVLTGRRADRLHELADRLTKLYGVGVLPLVFDVRDRSAVEAVLGSMPLEYRALDVLVNNAGLAAGLATVQESDPEDWDVMIDTNVKGLLYVSRVIIPWMIERGTGHVINIGSTAAKDVYPSGSVYCATKHAVDAISKGMRIDLLPHGIKVTNVNPGAAETEFSLVRFKGDQERASKVYDGIDPIRAEDIAEVVYFAATRPPHIVLNDIIVTPLAQASSSYIHRKA